MIESLTRMILRRYPFKSGFYKVADSPLVKRLIPRPAPGRVGRVRTRWGLDMEVLLDDMDGRCLDLMGECDARITWTCSRLLRPGDTFIDIGSNFGLESLVAAQAVGPRGRVHAFEPQPDLAAMVARSAEMNGFSWLSVHQVALSDQAGEMTLVIPDGHSGGASLVRGAGAGEDGVLVPVRKGDEFLRDLGVGEIRLLKIDVEGHEAEVFDGLSSTFAASPPHAVIFESNSWYEGLGRGKAARDYPFGDTAVVKFLRDHGYRFYAFERSYLRVTLQRTPSDAAEHPPVSDFLAIHESRCDELAPRIGVRP